MAIVKMKRLRLVGMRSDRESLLRLLQKLGCVEVSEPAIDLTDPDWAALAKPEGGELAGKKEQEILLNNALTTLKKYAPKKKGLFHPRPEITEQELFDDAVYAAGLETAGAINDAQRELASLTAERGKLETQQASLAPWVSLDVPLETEGDDVLSVLFGTVPAKAELAAVEAAVAAQTDLFQLFEAGSDGELKYFLLLCHASVESACAEAMRPFGFSRAALRGWTGTAADNTRMLDNQIAVIDEKIMAAKEHIASYGGQKDLLCRCIDRVAQDVSREEAKARLIDTDQTFYLSGWVVAEREDELMKALGGYTCAWEIRDPVEEEYPQVPVKLKNNLLTEPLNMVTDMYSLPAYDGLDPNPLMAPFFVLFYGLMMADMAYGILMILGGVLMLKLMHARGTMKNFAGLLILCGISTFVVGAMTGGFFGDFIPQIAKLINPNTTLTALPALFTPLNDTIMILLGSLVLGVIQIITGMIISVVYKIRNGQFVDALFSEITWWIILAGAAMAILGVGSVAGVPIVLVVGVLMLAVGGTRHAKGFGKVASFVGLVYNGVSGYFSDILSYARIMALMLAGSVIAQVFNTLGGVTGNVVGFVVISMIGNILNFALNLLGCYVHDLRLQCLEFFNRFYKEGGKPFAPLSVKTKYVDIQEQ